MPTIILNRLAKIVLWLLVMGLLVILFGAIEAVVMLPLASFFSWIFIGFALSIGAFIGHACYVVFVSFIKWAFN